MSISMQSAACTGRTDGPGRVMGVVLTRKCKMKVAELNLQVLQFSASTNVTLLGVENDLGSIVLTVVNSVQPLN